MTDDQHDQLPLAASPASAQVGGLTETASAKATTADTATDTPSETANGTATDGTAIDRTDTIGDPTARTSPRRRRGSRGGRNRRKPGSGAAGFDGDDGDEDDEDGQTLEPGADVTTSAATALIDGQPELPKRMSEGRPSVAASEQALVRKPQIGDTRPAPPMAPAVVTTKPAQARGDRNRQDRQKSDRVKGDRQPQQTSDEGSAS